MKYRPVITRGLLLLIIYFLSPSTSCASDLLIPLPGQKQIEKASASIRVPPGKINDQKRPPKKGGTLIPLPTRINRPKDPVKPVVTEEKSPRPADKPIIKINRPVPEPQQPSLEFPTPSDEVVINSSDILGDILDEASPVEVSVSDAPAGASSMPIFPKDTSSAIFMVMKTWICQDHDLNTLLKTAVETYGNEADDPFALIGLEDSSTVSVSLDEEDITLDELLDILASRTGRDWGADVAAKTIYFYPAGVKTDSFNVW